MTSPFDENTRIIPLTDRSVISIIVTEEARPRHHLPFANGRSSDRLSSSTLARTAASAAIHHLCASTAFPTPPDSRIGRGPRSEPLFPHPFRGSLAHTTTSLSTPSTPSQTASCAFVTLDEGILTIGIDIEQSDRSIRPGIIERVTTPTEYQGITAWQRDTEHCSAAWRSGLAIFCAKEAAVKALSPLVDYPLTLRAIPLRYSPRVLVPLDLSPANSNSVYEPLLNLGSFTLLEPQAHLHPLDGAVFLWHNLVIATAHTAYNRSIHPPLG